MSELANFLLAAALGAIGACMLIYLARLLFSQVFGWAVGSRDVVRLRRAIARVTRADELIKESRYEPALKELERSFIFNISNNREVINTAREHNQAILNRCLIVAENLQGSYQNLPEVERLLLERAEIQVLAMKTGESFKKITSKRGQAGKDVPSWSRSDYERRMGEIRKEMQDNLCAIERALRELFVHIRTPQRHDVTYH